MNCSISKHQYNHHLGQETGHCQHYKASNLPFSLRPLSPTPKGYINYLPFGVITFALLIQDDFKRT